MFLTFLMDGVQPPQGYKATTMRQFAFCYTVPRNSWHSFYRPRKNQKLSRPWSHPPSGLEYRTPGLGIQRLNHCATAALEDTVKDLCQTLFLFEMFIYLLLALVIKSVIWYYNQELNLLFRNNTAST